MSEGYTWIVYCHLHACSSNHEQEVDEQCRLGGGRGSCRAGGHLPWIEVAGRSQGHSEGGCTATGPAGKGMEDQQIELHAAIHSACMLVWSSSPFNSGKGLVTKLVSVECNSLASCRGFAPKWLPFPWHKDANTSPMVISEGQNV